MIYGFHAIHNAADRVMKTWAAQLLPSCYLVAIIVSLYSWENASVLCNEI